MQYNQVRTYRRFIGPHDPCPPKLEGTYIVAPNLFLGFQPPHMRQFTPEEALRYGTLWPALFSPYGRETGKN